MIYIIKSFLLKHLDTVKKIKTVIAILLGIMIVIDLVLVSTKNQLPTFSQVIEGNRSNLIWLNFLLGALISKVFYNRTVMVKRKEISGFFAITGIVFLLFLFTYFVDYFISTPWQLVVMISGGITAHLVWPQYYNIYN